METHVGREKIRPRCKWAHVRAPGAPKTTLGGKKFKYKLVILPTYLVGGFFRYLLFAADTKHPGQCLCELHWTRPDDDCCG